MNNTDFRPAFYTKLNQIW